MLLIDRLKDVEMYTFKIIDETEYEVDDQYYHIWIFKRKKPIHVNQKNNGNVFVFKNSSVTDDIYFGEVIGSRIAQATIGNACQAELAAKQISPMGHSEHGVSSYYYFAEGDKAIATHYIFKQYFTKEVQKQNDVPTIDTVLKALSYMVLQEYHRDYAEYERVKQQYIDMIMFDCKFGNYDRGLPNWMLYEDGVTGEIKLYPLYDNEAVLGFDQRDVTEDSEEIIQYLKYQKTRYRIAEREIDIPDIAGKVIQFLLVKYPKEAYCSLEKIKRFSVEDLKNLLEEFPDMTEERKRYTLKMMLASDLLLDQYQEKAALEMKKKEEKEQRI